MLAQKNCEIQVLKVIFNLEIISKLTGPALWTSPFGCQVVKNKSKLKIRQTSGKKLDKSTRKLQNSQ